MRIKTLLLFFLISIHGRTQTANPADVVKDYFSTYTTSGYRPASSMGLDSLITDEELHEIRIYANESFCSQPLTSQNVKHIYQTLQRILPTPYNTYHLAVISRKGTLIEDLIPNLLRDKSADTSRLWGNTKYNGYPWVQNLSKPYQITRGLQNRHLFIWASHGRYFAGNIWKWQRPYLFCTTEDMFTQSFVYPFLFPMLENAGAIVGTPRERDYQTHEAIVDNDSPDRHGFYAETVQGDATWNASPDSSGFATPAQLLVDSVQPFRNGTFRYANATTRHTGLSTATWTPRIPQSGSYAVYVSYATRPNSVPDALYTVYHKGGRTQFRVNQQMGGGTWLYLGTFQFDAGCSQQGRVTLSNHSDHRGIVTADAVRFGGGVGQTERGTAGTSGLPRYLEAARYYAQWAGVPDTLFNTELGANDYADDLRARGHMLNYLGGGSVYQPQLTGLRVPFELSLALHSDAGYRTDKSIYGSLSICTSQDGEGNTFYTSGLSRLASRDFSALLLNNLTADLSSTFGTTWARRENWDRNYAETRMPGVPSAILEMLSHQNFLDMKYGHDPIFKFTLARSVYKSVLRFVSYEHGVKDCAVQPLPVHCFAASVTDDGTKVRLSWLPRTDSLESSAIPTGYIVYTKTDGGDFDNGTAVGNVNECLVNITPHTLYAFKVTAINDGGESFPSETLSAYYSPESSHKVLIVNGFNRLSGPACIETCDSLGFDLGRDIGVPYISTTAFSGRQQNFNPLATGITGPDGHGYSGQELMGHSIAGNTFDYPCCHGLSIAAVDGRYTFSSASSEAFSQPTFAAENYSVIDYIAGLQADFPYNLRHYQTFPPAVRKKLTDYLNNGGALLVSGSFIGSDNFNRKAERHFTEQVLKFKYDGTAHADSTDFVNGLNMQFNIYRSPSSDHYAAQSPDAILPADAQAFSAFAYGGGQGAGVAYKGNSYSVISMGFPFECISDTAVRHAAMKAMLQFLTEKTE